MRGTHIVYLLSFVVFMLILVSLQWLTATEEEADPCGAGQTDISAAALAADEGDQEALVNRAIILRGKCEKP